MNLIHIFVVLAAVTRSCGSDKIYHIGPDGVPDTVTRIQVSHLDLLLSRLHALGCLHPEAYLPLKVNLSRASGDPRRCVAPEPLSGDENHLGIGHGNDSMRDTTSELRDKTDLKQREQKDWKMEDIEGIQGETEEVTDTDRNTRDEEDISLTEGSEPISQFQEKYLDSFTLCFWTNTDVFFEKTVVLSYAVSDYHTNVLNVGFSTGTVEVRVGENKWAMDGEMEPLRWYLVCVQQASGRFILTLDGKDLMESNTNFSLPLNGTLVLGNEQDTLGGGFSAVQAYRGSVTNLTLWPKSLSPQELAALNDCILPGGSLLTWSHIPWRIHGNVQVREGDACKEMHKEYGIFVQKHMPFCKARIFCHSLGMSLPLPKSSEEVSSITSLINEHTQECRLFYTAAPVIWLDVEYDENTRQVQEGERCQALNSLPPLRHASGGESPQMDGYGNRQDRDAAFSACVLCLGKKNTTKIYMQGLCEGEDGRSNDHSIFYPRGDSNGSFYMHGPTGLKVQCYNDSVWYLEHPMSKPPVATITSPDLPLGRRKWQVTNSEVVCGKDTANTGPRHLILSWCQPGYFSCWSGGCVPLSRRCSLVSDCEDHSDEIDCHLVHLPGSYQSSLSPVHPKLYLGLSLKLTRIASVDLISMLVSVAFTLKICWRDQRLVFTNLRDQPQHNVLQLSDLNSIWLPNIKVVNQSRLAGSVSPVAQLRALKEVAGKDNGTDYVYSGEDTSLEYTLEYESSLWCTFHLSRYPFDTQTCAITLEVTNAPEDLVTYTYLRPHLDRSGPHRQQQPDGVPSEPDLMEMAEFYLDDLTLDLKNQSRLVTARFRLIRRPAYHLFSTYLPTVFLHAIGYFTLSIPAQDFQDRGVMSLTTMLVLVSLYTEIQSGLPKTAYLKYIDFWFIFSISFFTVIIMVHLATSRVDDAVRVFQPGAAKRTRRLRVLLGSNDSVLRAARLSLGVTYIIFQALYWMSLFA